MKPLILLVEDNTNIQTYIKMILEHNECRVITADNGKLAIELLKKSEESPDLIISDILMPEMDGYDFFKNISVDTNFCHIPFIFLSALDSPEDVRLGKILGADDYLTKPINEEDLLFTVAGKIIRSKNVNQINDKIKDFFIEHKEEITTTISEEEISKTALIKVIWDDITGPLLDEFYPENVDLPLNQIGIQLYDAVSSIYGQDKITDATGILVNIENFKLTGYSFFNSYPDHEFRGGERDYMFGVIAPKISYFQSLVIKEILTEVSNLFKENKKVDLKSFWERISEKLSTSPI